VQIMTDDLICHFLATAWLSKDFDATPQLTEPSGSAVSASASAAP
jgi:hypothetical protein